MLALGSDAAVNLPANLAATVAVNVTSFSRPPS